MSLENFALILRSLNLLVVFSDDWFSYCITIYGMESNSKCETGEMWRVLLHGRKSPQQDTNPQKGKIVDFSKYLAVHGIRTQWTVPEMSQYKGVSERLNQTLINTTRCLSNREQIIDSGLKQCPLQPISPKSAHPLQLKETFQRKYSQAQVAEQTISGFLVEKPGAMSTHTEEGASSTAKQRSISHKCISHKYIISISHKCIFVGCTNGIESYKLYKLEKTFLWAEIQSLKKMFLNLNLKFSFS